MVLRELWNDQALRDAVTISAKSQIEPKEGKAANLSDVLGQIRSANTLPIGWQPGDPARGLPQDAWSWLKKVVGFLVSAVAITMGAPFWFDLLNKLINLRLAGNRPPDSREKQPASA